MQDSIPADIPEKKTVHVIAVLPSSNLSADPAIIQMSKIYRQQVVRTEVRSEEIKGSLPERQKHVITMKVKFLDMDTKKKPLFIAFSSQKGGVGKSTFTTLLASTLHYRMGYNVAVFDADFPQFSLSKMKSRDLTMVMENENLKKQAYRQFTVINKKAYPIIQHKADTVLEAANDFIQSTVVVPDFIFFDLPGTVNTAGILNALAGMHHIFTPITADRLVMESTLIFTQLLQDVVMKKGETSIETINLFWNQVDGRESTPLYTIYEELIQQLGLSLMDSRIKNSTRFRKESEKDSKTVFRSTLLPPDERVMKTVNLDVFISEFLKIIQL